MARGGLGAAEGGRMRDYGGGVTVSVVVTCLVAASCGLIFGYDIGVSGGVTQMDSFLTKFFPEVLRGKKSAKSDAYCRYDNQLLTAFSSSMYLAAMLSSLVASTVTRRVGRKASMLIGGALFLAGSGINAGAVNIAMLIIGRMLLGFGVGFTAQSAPMFLAETSPTRWRGGFTMAYHFFIVIGTLAASIVNYFTNRIPDWGWRVSLGFAALPAAVIVVGALFISDTPSSLVLRGDPNKARMSLQRIRGVGTDIEVEFNDIVCAVEEARRNDEGVVKRLCSKSYRHYLMMMVAIPVFFDFTGVIVMSVFTPVLFRIAGFTSQKAVLGSVITNLVGLFAVTVSSIIVDRCGRRILFLVGGIGMMLLQVAVAWVLADHLGTHQGMIMPRNYAVGVLVLMCLYIFCFHVSLGPLRWLVVGEIYPVDIRSTGQAMTLCIALPFTFAQTQVFLTLLCAMKYGIFLFYAGWITIMTIFIVSFLPETKGVPMELMWSAWERHWFWRRFVIRDVKQEVQLNHM